MKHKALYIGSNHEFYSRLSDGSKTIDIQYMAGQFLVNGIKEKFELYFLEIPKGKAGSIKYDSLFKQIADNNEEAKIIFITADENFKHKFSSKVSDIFSMNTAIEDIDLRARFIIQNKHNKKVPKPYRKENIISVRKRAFDIIFASIALLLLLPLLLIVALAIRIESKGKVFYAAKRVGLGYKVFDFYKFRSMYTNSDKNVDALMKESQYAKENKSKESLTGKPAVDEDTLLIGDDEMILEADHLRNNKLKQDNSFFKMKNDPRITKVGRIIRNTSIDELPQLINVLKGDMSIVGNRPLPLYEAELLTSDQWAQRYLAPAGLTGLWQVTKRGNSGSLSADERKQLDIEYAKNPSFWQDLKIIFRTLPAMIQKENV